MNVKVPSKSPRTVGPQHLSSSPALNLLTPSSFLGQPPMSSVSSGKAARDDFQRQHLESPFAGLPQGSHMRVKVWMVVGVERVEGAVSPGNAPLTAPSVTRCLITFLTLVTFSLPPPAPVPPLGQNDLSKMQIGFCISMDHCSPAELLISSSLS